MRAAFKAELRETARIIRHFLPLGRALRVTAEFAAVVVMVGAVVFVSVASTTPAQHDAVMVAEASR